MTPPSRPGLEQLLAQRIAVLDGAMGTMLQGFELCEADFRGERFAEHASDLKGDNEVLVLTRPDLIRPGARGLPGGRRRHHRDQQLRRDAGGPGRLRTGGSVLRS